jgi:hypothetical protein
VLAGVDRFPGIADIVQDRRGGQQVRMPAQNGDQVACRAQRLQRVSPPARQIPREQALSQGHRVIEDHPNIVEACVDVGRRLEADTHRTAVRAARARRRLNSGQAGLCGLEADAELPAVQQAECLAELFPGPPPVDDDPALAVLVLGEPSGDLRVATYVSRSVARARGRGTAI